MTYLFFRRMVLKLALLALLALPELVSAQEFFNTQDYGGVYLGFRKTGNNIANPTYELVVTLGNITNILNLPAGTTTNITQYGPSQLTDAFGNGFGHLQWSVFASFPNSLAWTNPLGVFPEHTIWFTQPCTNVTLQTTPPTRGSITQQGNWSGPMYGVGDGAGNISSSIGTTNADNNTNLVRESVSSYAEYDLSSFIGDSLDPTNGDFGSGGSPMPNDQSVENWTPASFTTSERCDFYQCCPVNTKDPITGLTGKSQPYFVGYFILNASGTMTFTRASLVSTPSAGTVTASVTNGFGPLTVVFTNSSSSGSITNWVWNFGNGTLVTNTTSGNVTNTYTASGSYTVTLTVYGPGGTNSYTVANYIVASPKPKLGSLTVSAGKLIFSGTNCPSGVQYRILSSTNAATTLANWTPVYTNTFGSNGTFAYTNSIGTTNSYFIMVSP